MSTTSPAFAVGALLEALSVETSLEGELALVLDREHTLLVAMSLEDLLRLEAQKEALLERVRTQAQTVKDCMKDVATVLHASETDAKSLTRLVEHLTEPDRTRLRSAQEQLLALTKRVREQNRVNDRLIHGSLSYVSQYLNLLRSMLTGPSGYSANGVLPGHQESGRILTLKG
jgi:flagellar biosynthesis/type III secretory pathway chaperone